SSNSSTVTVFVFSSTTKAMPMPRVGNCGTGLIVTTTKSPLRSDFFSVSLNAYRSSITSLDTPSKVVFMSAVIGCTCGNCLISSFNLSILYFTLSLLFIVFIAINCALNRLYYDDPHEYEQYRLSAIPCKLARYIRHVRV